MNWYAIFVQTGKEEIAKKRLCDQLKSNIICFVPKRKIPEKRKGVFYDSLKIMFPGYVFIHTEMDYITYYKIQEIPEVIKMLNYNNKKDRCVSKSIGDENLFFKFIPDSQMQSMLKIANENDVIDYIKIALRNKRVSVLSDSFKELERKIMKIDKRKRRAKLIFNILGSEKTMEFGIEVILPVESCSEKFKNLGENNIMNIENEIRKLIITILELSDDCELDNELKNIGLNSINFIRLIISIEKEFCIEIPDEFLTIEKVSTINELTLLVRDVIGKGDL